MDKKPLNFKKDERKAEAWSKKRYSAWIETLPQNRQEALEAFKRSSKEMNRKLNEVRGNIDELTDEQLKNQIKEMNIMIKQPVNLLKERQIIYTHFDPKALGYSNELQMLVGSESRQLDRGKIKTVLNEYQYGNLTDLKTGNLTLTGGETGQYYVAELELPKGTYVGHLGDGQTVLPTDYAIEITNNMFSKPKVIRENGKELIKVNARLIKKEKIESKIRVTETTLTKLFKNGSFVVKLDIGGGFESYAIDHAKEAISTLIKQLPSKLLNDAIDYLDSITFTDVKLNNNDGTLGYHDSMNVFVRVKHEILIQKLDPIVNQSAVLLHEMGHVVDSMLLNDTSKNRKFIDIYNEEKDNLTSLVTHNNYGREDSVEFFAEIFKAMYSTDPKQQDAVKKEAPKAVDYIKTKIKEYIEDN
ncbi:lethal factor domain protein [Paenibacillus thiaminolyticus]|uniref:Lethal factor domain protein n=1 Tax=Paenibacillus thiaminolyticus TaxID=49283 RepID=A0AAP9IZF2_PANTH|nr:ADP-ribosyltransferase [Paenibacillus thiaminolyticus]MCY9536710.1 lethal factor domain protein [Paenibacillus thiaminolyticus]MCY9600509.1 lethal factor domain protein [Paenibacillus thiaminolyticus]MCY9606610.1 lethal factor domain protein [Paenibacillus thiaminolyticus]MCY9614885.1 lethal factor domain protein [Paenibacillus thiaminolyticus]MCY9619822.1 lethal factor domain protein [Paenibacillus thiaminolyticus]